MRKVRVVNRATGEREVRLYWHHDFRISESDVGDTAAYDPETQTVTHYKGWRYFLANVMRRRHAPASSASPSGRRARPAATAPGATPRTTATSA